MMMRTLTTAVAVLAAAAALFGSVLITQAKGPFRAEISGGDLDAPVTIEGPLDRVIIFQNDAFPSKPPVSSDLSYTIRLMPADPNAGEDFVMVLTYFPDVGDAPGLLRGEWDNGARYFQVTPQFRAMLDDAIAGRDAGAAGAGDDGVSAVWYIAPSLAGVGLLLAGGLAGRRLFSRHDE